MDDSLLSTASGRQRLATDFLPDWLQSRRWSGGRQRNLRGCKILEAVAFGPAWWCLIEARWLDGGSDRFSVPLAWSDSVVEAERIAPAGGGWITDATLVEPFRQEVFRALVGGRVPKGFRVVCDAQECVGTELGASRVLRAQQSNTSLVYGDRWFVKLFRKMEPGLNPDVEVTRFLSAETSFRHAPRFLGAMQWHESSVVMATTFAVGSEDAWALALRHAVRPDEVSAWVPLARRLGELTGEMHSALASSPSNPAFAPEPLDVEDAQHIITAALRTAADAADRLVNGENHLSAETEALLPEFMASLDDLRPVARLLEAARGKAPTGWKTRIHGDYHLGQVLHTGGDFLVADFEGEPMRPLDERRMKEPPIRDVAGMLRSFHYAAHAARGHGSVESAENWAAQSQAAFLDGWRSVTRGAPFADETFLLIYLLQKAFYELEYELRYRPDWAAIPLRGLITLCRQLR